jgi:hypothetical protein
LLDLTFRSFPIEQPAMIEYHLNVKNHTISA